jgi:hypothetical protein
MNFMGAGKYGEEILIQKKKKKKRKHEKEIP